MVWPIISAMKTTPDLDLVSRILREYLPGPEYHAVLFGSRASGHFRAGSDWDIGISGPGPVRGAILQSIRDRLEELPTLHTFDIVDLSTTPGSFRAPALKDAVPLV